MTGLYTHSRKALSSDQVEFDALYRRTRARAYLFARRLVGNRADAEDIMQEAYLRAWRHFGDYNRNCAFEKWVFRILKNIVVDRSRSPKYQSVISLDNLVAHDLDGLRRVTQATVEGDPEEICLRRLDMQNIQRALDTLPALQRQTVALVDLEGHDYRETAALTHCPMGTVRSRLHRGRAHLRQALEDTGSEYTRGHH